MVHELVMRLATSAGARGDRAWDFLAYLVVGVASVGIAGAIYRWYERPLERALRASLVPAPPAPAPEPAHARIPNRADHRSGVPHRP